jgi:hypothetical protein
MTGCGGFDQALIGLRDGQRIEAKALSANNEWRTYRAEAQRNALELIVDGSVIIETADNRFLSGGTVGLWSTSAQVEVRNFRVQPP